MSDLSEIPMLDLFRMEAESQTQVLTSALLVLERDPAAADQLELSMRAAHSLKGAARIIGLSAGVAVAHAMEDCLVAAQEARLRLGRRHIDLLLAATDLLGRIAHTSEPEMEEWTGRRRGDIDACVTALARLAAGGGSEESTPDTLAQPAPLDPALMPGGAAAPAAVGSSAASWVGRDNSDRVLRVTAESLNGLLGLAAQSMVESRWVKPFADSLLRLQRMQRETCRSLDSLRDALSNDALDDRARAALADAHRRGVECRDFLAQRLGELDMFDRRSLHLSHRLYDEALACRMRPFGDGIQGFPRMVRDVGMALGKQVRLEVLGESTQVDRDILMKLDAPLGHLLRNAVDHGIEAPEERLAAGKPAEGVVRLEAHHRAGTLQVIVSDDGRGVDVQRTRELVAERKLIGREAAALLNEAELLEFLFLPGFTAKDAVTDISGRGVGLDVVRTMVSDVRGTVRIVSRPNQGTRFVLELPVTLSVVRTLLTEIAGEPYAFPLSAIARTLRLPKDRIALLEGRQHFDFDGQRVGLLSAHQVLGIGDPPAAADEIPVVVLEGSGQIYGVVVDRFLGERELVVQPLDPQLGKVKDVAAGALMDDGSPVLILDPEDLVRSMEKLVTGGHLAKVLGGGSAAGGPKRRKRVLVVDDSLTVRELERKLLGSHGYEVEIAVDGMDGWNAVRSGRFDLVVTDVDMPRMDGIELVSLIRKDPHLQSVPVMVVSYKDREEDRRRGLEAGAAYYLTKGSFHDETLVRAVADLIGEADA